MQRFRRVCTSLKRFCSLVVSSVVLSWLSGAAWGVGMGIILQRMAEPGLPEIPLDWESDGAVPRGALCQSRLSSGHPSIVLYFSPKRPQDDPGK